MIPEAPKIPLPITILRNIIFPVAGVAAGLGNMGLATVLLLWLLEIHLTKLAWGTK